MRTAKSRRRWRAVSLGVLLYLVPLVAMGAAGLGFRALSSAGLVEAKEIASPSPEPLPTPLDINAPRFRPRPEVYARCIDLARLHLSAAEYDAREDWCSQRFLTGPRRAPFAASRTEVPIEDAAAAWLYGPVLRWANPPAEFRQRVFVWTDRLGVLPVQGMQIVYAPDGILETTDLQTAIEKGAVVLEARFIRPGEQLLPVDPSLAIARGQRVSILDSQRAFKNQPHRQGKNGSDYDELSIWMDTPVTGGTVRWTLKLDPLRYTQTEALYIFDSLTES